MSRPEPARRVARRQNHGETRGDRDACISRSQLIAIVQRGVAEPGPRWALRALHWNRIAHLMPLRPDGPLLRERELPRGRTQRPLPGADVLDDTRLLVVCLFH